MTINSIKNINIKKDRMSKGLHMRNIKVGEFLFTVFFVYFCTFAPMQKYQKISTQKEGMAHSGEAKY